MYTVERKDNEYVLAVDDTFVTPRGSRSEHKTSGHNQLQQKIFDHPVKDTTSLCVSNSDVKCSKREREVIATCKKGDLEYEIMAHSLPVTRSSHQVCSN